MISLLFLILYQFSSKTRNDSDDDTWGNRNRDSQNQFFQLEIPQNAFVFIFLCFLLFLVAILLYLCCGTSLCRCILGRRHDYEFGLQVDTEAEKATKTEYEEENDYMHESTLICAKVMPMP